MTGRGIDQALPTPVGPQLYESFIKDARQYLQLAEEVNGDIDEPVSYDYIWGEALEVWEQREPDLRIINLEMAVTTHDEPWPRKGINYRMHPENVKVLQAAGVDFCSLANNHVLDWGVEGLRETVKSLNEAGIKNAGAGEDLQAASEPVIFERPAGRVLLYSCGSQTSGIPGTWAATENEPGLNLLPNLERSSVDYIKQDIERRREPGDLVVVSIHWGGNWGYDVPQEQQDFAHALIDKAGVDVVHGHSSHHPKPIEVYQERLILYGAGDFINDYEGISGREQYRGELTLMYFPELSSDGHLISLEMLPMEIKQFRLIRASEEDVQWLQTVLNRESQKFGAEVELKVDGILELKW